MGSSKRRSSRMVRPAGVDQSMLSRRKAATEHDRQNSSKRAPGAMGTTEGGRPPGPWGSSARVIHNEVKSGVCVRGKSLLMGPFVQLLLDRASDLRVVAPDVPSAVAWARQRRTVFSSGEYLGDQGMSSETAGGLDDPVPVAVTVTMEDSGSDVSADIQLGNNARLLADKVSGERVSELTKLKTPAQQAAALLAIRSGTGDHWARRAALLAELSEEQQDNVLSGLNARMRERALEALAQHNEEEAEAGERGLGGRRQAAPDRQTEEDSASTTSSRRRRDKPLTCGPRETRAFLSAVLDAVYEAIDNQGRGGGSNSLSLQEFLEETRAGR